MRDTHDLVPVARLSEVTLQPLRVVAVHIRRVPEGAAELYRLVQERKRSLLLEWRPICNRYSLQNQRLARWADMFKDPMH